MSAKWAAADESGRRTTADATPPDGGAALMPWWSSPAGISVGFLIPLILLIIFAGQAELSTLTIRGIQFLDLRAMVIVGGMISVAAVGGWLGSQVRLSGHDATTSSQWEVPAMVLGCIALVAYIIWFREILFSPALMYSILTGAQGSMRDADMLTPGITSLVNVAPTFFAVYAYRALLCNDVPVRRFMHVLAVVLVFFTLFRAQVWSERLAVIEMSVPFGLAFAQLLMKRRGGFMQAIRLWGPYMGLPLLILFFGAAEYFRSWTSNTYNGKTGFWEFAIGRLISYYYTSLNNGAGMLATTDWPTFRFEFTFAWLRAAPLMLGPLFVDTFADARDATMGTFLTLYGDPEFNSPGGMFSALVDLGGPLGVAYAFATGLFSGLMFTAYRERRLVGILLYPMCFIAFLEVLRYLYFGQPRAFTTALGALLLMGFLKISRLAEDRRAMTE